MRKSNEARTRSRCCQVYFLDSDPRTAETISSPFSPQLVASVTRRRKLSCYKLWATSTSRQGTCGRCGFGTKASSPRRAASIEEAWFANPSHWPEAEARLQDMIAHHGVQFCEPLNRLATLYYMQGRYAESKKLCQLVLDQKPWHFGALSGIVMVCASTKDIQGARQWAARRLPPMVPNGTSDNHRRKIWARRAVDDARKALMEEEERIRQAFGKRQRYEKQQRLEQSQPDEESWQ